MASLVFIDTNIYLDFYRVTGREGDLSILDLLDGHRDRVISTYQVEMEFKKNRQKVIVEAHKGLSPGNSPVQIPAFLARSKESQGLNSKQTAAKKYIDTLRERTVRVLENPTVHDQVYKTAQRVFKETSRWNLSRQRDERHEIRDLAEKRFFLGYPPRKDRDTSIGDGVNWEWIVHCAKASGEDIVIVSRDGDYGQTFNSKTIINDWLLQEFRERISRKRKLQLTNRLTEGLQLAGIKVSKAAAKSEERFVFRLGGSGMGSMSRQDVWKILRRWNTEMKADVPGESSLASLIINAVDAVNKDEP